MQDRPERTRGSHALREERRPRNTADAPVEYDDEHGIEHDVADGRRDQKPQRRFAVAERREHAGRNVVDKKEQKPPNVNMNRTSKTGQ